MGLTHNGLTIHSRELFVVHTMAVIMGLASTLYAML